MKEFEIQPRIVDTVFTPGFWKMTKDWKCLQDDNKFHHGRQRAYCGEAGLSPPPHSACFCVVGASKYKDLRNSLYFRLKQTLKLKDDVLLQHARPHYQIPLFLCNDALFREFFIQYGSLEWFHSVISSHFKTSKASLHALVLG